MLKAIVLICGIAVQPDECTEATAIDIVRSDLGRSDVSCGLFGQAGIAITEVRPEMGRTYQKVICKRAK